MDDSDSESDILGSIVRVYCQSVIQRQGVRSFIMSTFRLALLGHRCCKVDLLTLKLKFSLLEILKTYLRSAKNKTDLSILKRSEFIEGLIL